MDSTTNNNEVTKIYEITYIKKTKKDLKNVQST